MLNKQHFNLLVWIAATIVAVCSCASDAQELSAYWSGHDFSSLSGFDDIDVAEDKFDGYINLLTQARHKDAVASMTAFLDSASHNVVAYMVWSSWFEPYLHAKESPYRNDKLFKVWLDKVLADEIIDDGAMMAHLEHLKVVLDKNITGAPLQDVALFDENGEELMISDLVGERMLILMVDADCPSCLKSLEDNAKEYKKTKLVAVLVGGSRLHIDNIRRQMPESVLKDWILVCGSRRKMEGEGLYDLTYLPTRLLVSPKGVIIKSYH